MSHNFQITIMYIGETSEACVRGTLSFICLTFFETAGVMTVIIGAYCSYKILALIAAVFPVLFFITFYFMPETPYFYLRKGDVRGACRSLQQFRGKEDVSEELTVIHANVEEVMSYRSSVLDLIREKCYRKPLCIILGEYRINITVTKCISVDYRIKESFFIVFQV